MENTIHFVIPTYNHGDKLVSCISSIVCQTSPNWTINIVNDCGEPDGIDKVKKIYGDDSRIVFTELDERKNDWGHSPRNLGLMMCKDEFIVLSGGDNIYIPTFVEEILNGFKNPKVKFVFTNMVHNWVKQDYVAVDCKLRLGGIDIGNGVMRTEIAQNYKLNIKKATSDWDFFHEYIVNNCKDYEIVKIEKYLYVHN